MKFLTFVFLGAMALCSAAAAPDSVSLAWDKSPSADVVGYTVWWGTASKNWTQSQDAGNSLAATITGLPAGSYFFVVIARNSVALESEPSNEISTTLVDPPDAAENLRITGTILANISTRAFIQTGDKVMIGGFIIRGNAPKAVVLRGLGLSLVKTGLPAASVLNDPVVELHGPSGALIASNDNWKDSPQRSQIEGTVFQPTDDREAVILATLPPAAYTVILQGAGQTNGVGLIELYDNDQAVDSDLANLSTRGFLVTGDNVLIGGFTLGGSNNPARIAVRALGPSLSSFGLNPVLADPTLELHDANGTLMMSNDDWESDPVSAAQLTGNGLAPTNPKEAALFTALAPPAQFTAVVTGKNGGIGAGIVEIYNIR